MSNTLVSVVIPTRNRPELVLRAVRSAFNQTYRDIEVIVVIDGPDSASHETLRTIPDARLKIIALKQSVGGSDARNIGVENANGDWVAFLDDDDEWLTTKIVKQMDLALHSNSLFPVVTCYFIGRTPLGDFIGPRRTPDPEEPLCEYLFSRRGFFPREGQLQTTLILTSRELMRRVPFTSGLQRHQDTDWYLRIAAVAGVEIKFVCEPLSIWYLEDNRPKVSGASDWRYSLEWLRGVRSIITARAYAGFIATQLAPEASRQGDWAAFFPLLREAVAEGRALPIDLILYLGTWFIPLSLRRNLRLALQRVWPVRIEAPL